MQQITIRVKWDMAGFSKGTELIAHNHDGHYYWVVTAGRWMDKDLFTVVK